MDQETSQAMNRLGRFAFTKRRQKYTGSAAWAGSPASRRSMWQDVVIGLVVIMIIFGAGSVPEIAKSRGQDVKEFLEEATARRDRGAGALAWTWREARASVDANGAEVIGGGWAELAGKMGRECKWRGGGLCGRPRVEKPNLLARQSRIRRGHQR